MIDYSETTIGSGKDWLSVGRLKVEIRRLMKSVYTEMTEGSWRMCG